MKSFKLVAALLLLPLTAQADLQIDGIGGIANWYFHANFEQMRNTEAGKPLYAWMKTEIFDEIRDESGLDIDKDLFELIAQSDGSSNVVVMLKGNLSQEHKDQIMALAATQNVELLPRKAGRRDYFFVEGDHADRDDDLFADGAYFSFALDDRILLTSSEDRMREMLGSGGKLESRNSRAIVMFSAEKTLVEAGLETNETAAENWDSNIMKNTEAAALVIADSGGKLGVEAQLTSKEPEMANSLASIVRGLISLQAFNEDLDPEMVELLKQTRVDVKAKTMSISLALDPAVVVKTLNQ